jgi:hypothetical protein
MSRCTYCPLKPGEIRPIRLMPAPSFRDPIYVGMFSEELPDHENRVPRYTALSYVYVRRFD